MIEGELALALFGSVCVLLLFGFPVAFTLAGTALLFAAIGVIAGHFDASFVAALSGRMFGTITNDTLVAVPLFILMGVTLERAKIAEELLTAMTRGFGGKTGGLGISVIVVGALLAASTGIVGATVVTMGVLALPSMLRAGYNPSLATGLICATGTLGQIIPPSIALVLLGDIMSTAYQQAQLESGIINTQTVSVGDLFVGSLVPGLLLVTLYLGYLLFVAWRNPSHCPAPIETSGPQVSILGAVAPPLFLITIVLGSIIMGAATPTEAAGVGAVGGLCLAAYKGALSLTTLQEIARSTMATTSMVFLILIGAALFSLVFRGFGGDELIEEFFLTLGGGPHVALLIVMLVMFLLGFILDFIEITFVVVPIVAPILLAMGFDPIWLGVMIAVNLQTSFLTPPFGFALFYLRGVADESVTTSAIYRGVIPFVGIQVGLLGLLWLLPEVVTWLPSTIGR
ncbi:MAG TPA: C4-dicarboxylate ABC transporter [Halieaceae bacterium]|nr:TRAP transporter large permease subunit [Pseudomonadota bacterium]RCL48334.1 MAG: C4-dicarboxylate ABC transporter [Halieaceae bacterium]HBQ02488.1 C4-dicarboxylate ABC transporter [Halieaceae bacterium]